MGMIDCIMQLDNLIVKYRPAEILVSKEIFDSIARLVEPECITRGDNFRPVIHYAGVKIYDPEWKPDKPYSGTLDIRGLLPIYAEGVKDGN